MQNGHPPDILHPCAASKLLPTSEQQEFMYHQLCQFRKTKAIWGTDFQNDDEYVEKSHCNRLGKKPMKRSENISVYSPTFLPESNG